MGKSSVRPVVRGFIAERYVRSLFTATSQICSWTAKMRSLNPGCPLCSGRSEVSPVCILSGVSHLHRATT